MDGPRDCHTVSEVNQTEKGKYHMTSLLYGVLKNDTNELIYKTEIDSQTQETNLWLPKWGGGKISSLE